MTLPWVPMPDFWRSGHARGRLAALALGSLGLAPRWPDVLAAPPTARPPRPSRVLRIAHRGASGYAPENTWAAFRHAVGLGVDMVELDVRRTRDHELVVCHDARLDRTAGVWSAVKRLSYRELQQVGVAGEKIPHFAEVLKFLTPHCAVNAELKERGLTEAAVATIKALGCQSQVLFSSFLGSELVRLKAIDPAVRVAALVGSTPVTLGTCLRFARLVQAEALSVNHAAFRRGLLTSAHRHGLAVYVWTVDDPEAIAHLKRLGVDGIMSNYPDLI